ncbi:hypothetical protein GQR58_003950 [Nymphon striatum]|nr:hypothetical protein GQR58_003950 [Nymphon striatum]
MKAFHPGIFIVSFGTSFSALAPVSRLKCTSPFKLISPKSICLRQSVPHDRRHRRFHFRFHRFHFHNLVFVSFLKLVEFAIPKGLEALNRCHSIYDIHWSSVDLACAITSNPSCLESTTSDEVKISPFAMLTNFSAATVGTNGFLIHSITVSPYTVEWTTCLMDWKVSSFEYLVNLRCRVGKIAHFVQHEEYFTKPRMAPCHLVIIFATHNLVGSSTATDSRSHNDLFDATFSHQELNKPQKVLNNMKPTKSQYNIFIPLYTPLYRTGLLTKPLMISYMAWSQVINVFD